MFGWVRLIRFGWVIYLADGCVCAGLRVGVDGFCWMWQGALFSNIQNCVTLRAPFNIGPRL